MGQPVVHFEIIGRDPAGLRDFYGALFAWQFDTSGPVPPVVSQAGQYGFVDQTTASHGAGIPGGVGGGTDHQPRALFYVGVPDVKAALDEAERLGATRLWGPQQSPSGDLIVGQFIDPEGNVIGLANVV
jgi:predicted enzyme related to lactoylglutathione lyase